ncbi:MAG: signal peptidase [Clostridia bacterium]|nr:lepB [Clostridiales bacterium]MDK2985265.1 signal peptidase [Clostridia bacterium]
MQKTRSIVMKILTNEIVLAIIIALFLKAFIVDSRYVPSASMYPTLQINDRLLVNKLAYRFSEPERGDIVIFTPPPVVDSKYDYVKRIIGLPGEVVEIKNGKVYINGNPLEEDYIAENPNYHFGPAKIPPGHLLVLGDNRNKSFDGHLWKQWLSIDSLKGKVFFRYWPLDRIGVVK